MQICMQSFDFLPRITDPIGIGDVMVRRTIATKKTSAKTSGGHKLFYKQVAGGRRIYKVPSRGKLTAWSKVGGGKAIKYKLAKAPSVSGINVGVIRRKFGVSQEELGRVTGYSTRSIAGWESGQKLSESARQKLTETERLRAALTEIMPAGSLGEWLRNPNPAFENQTPLQ